MSLSSASGKRRAQALEIIDVDEYAQKFEPSAGDIVTLDAKEYRKSVRKLKKETDHPSIIGDVIKRVRALHNGPSVAKRQKVDHPPRDRILYEHRATRSPSASSSSGHVQAVKRPATTLDITDSEDERVQTLLRVPPPKKPRTNAPRSLQVAHPPQAVRRPEVIELFSDDSDVELEAVEEDSDWDPPGWDVNNGDRWTPMRLNPERVNNLASSLQTMSINSSCPLDNSPPPIDNTARFRPKPVPQSHQRWKQQYVWEMLPAIFQPRSRHRFMELPTQPILRSRREEYEPLLSARFQCITKFKQSPGAINNVQQKGQWTVVTSGCIGGEPDTEEEERSPYNQSGSLITYSRETRKLEIPFGHVGKYGRQINSEEAWTKHYAAHDAQFDPLWDIFVSSGADRKVLIWTIPSDEDNDAELEAESEVFGTNLNTVWKKKHELSFSYHPNQLCFKPVCSDDEVSVLAIAEKKIQIFSLSDSAKPRKEVNFRLFPKKNEPHVVGTMVWGTGPTASCLFASSEPDSLIPGDEIPQALFTGRHKAFDVENETALYDFQAEEAGDSLCINSSGTIVALTTMRGKNSNILRLFDVGNQDKRPTATINVDPYPSPKDRGFKTFEGEVTSTAFSPDDVYLALGRNDNSVHVYDTRYLQRGPLYRLEHHGECRSAGKEKYGIAKVEWLHSEQTRRIALATAGEDGCVRLWNPLKAMDEENGQVIAEVNSDIGYFSVGDPYRGENRLVIGDLSGHVSFFDLEV